MATTVDKGLLLLQALADAETNSGGPVTNIRLAERLHLDQAQVSRILNALAAGGLVEREPDSRGYRVGPALFGMGAIAGHAEALKQVRPILRGLLRTWHEPAWLSVLSRSQVLTVLAEPSQWFAYFPVQAGALTPVWCSGPGRALTQGFSRDELAFLLKDELFVGGGPGAVRNPLELYERNAESNLQDAVVADSEFEHDVVEFSARAVCDQLGATVAVSIAIPRYRIAGRTSSMAESVSKAAERITSILLDSNPIGPTGDRLAT
ncbi:IclR family transcriptional regulator [Mycobacterium sp. 852013-50091_SCH5140682]|uniref:IclR family transcriptional regulator n=1 Tax=Mycobacterium sp. 852013-50091_SCH5140682 TaxID=1834109 RepID=UPI0007EA5315|nr:helix-turn-helix domain-containing protein [Mycobacterium sp. 852013-50091_SCH5140682]OBC12045.1 IclR family transcriptional regulator [Mycobacterium sp. 852013-50091_SCH5140682]